MDIEKERGRLAELIDRYWDAAYAEGVEGRAHDTPDGTAGFLRDEIDSSISNMVKQLEQAREALRLLKVAACPANCDKGVIPHQVAEDEWEPEQCQFCYEREQALNQQGEK